MKKENPHRFWFLKQLLLACAAVLVVITALSLILGAVTRHNKMITVPNFANMTMPEAERLAEETGLRVVESDSVYIRQMRRGGVYTQYPKAGSTVKKGRRISLTTNSRVPKKIAMPSLVGLSLQQARSEIQNRGLVLGRLEYTRDIATNIVLGQKTGGRNAQPGERILVGTKVDLVLGLHPSENHTVIPDFSGYTYTHAINAIHDASLNVGNVDFDRSVKSYNDTLKAVVCTQIPAPTRNTVPLGTQISLKFSLPADE